jgi:hypothetical protein
MKRFAPYQVDARVPAPEEPQVIPEDLVLLSLNPRYTALPMQHAVQILDEESTDDPVQLSLLLLLQAMESERATVSDAATPEQLIWLPDETGIDEREELV